MSNKSQGTPVTHVSCGSRSLDRKSITVGHKDTLVRFYRTSDPPIFAGFQVNWIEGTDSTTNAEFDISVGAGFGSKYMTLSVKTPGHSTVYEYVDITEVLTARVRAIIEEIEL